MGREAAPQRPFRQIKLSGFTTASQPNGGKPPRHKSPLPQGMCGATVDYQLNNSHALAVLAAASRSGLIAMRAASASQIAGKWAGLLR